MTQPLPASPPLRILVTGANGFVGRALCDTLQDAGHRVRASVRTRKSADGLNTRELALTGNLDSTTHWQDAVQGIDTVVHLAARVHVMHETADDPLAQFRACNRDATANLAAAAAAAGVKRFVYVSTIKVNGEQTHGTPFRSDDTAAPSDPYGISKWEAEQELAKIAEKTGLEQVVIRPPLVYGPGVKGNFLRILGLIKRGAPLPLGRLDNRRTLVGLHNLRDLIRRSIEHPDAGGHVFLAGDRQPVSTTDLTIAMAHALGRPARLFHIPDFITSAACALPPFQRIWQRLAGSLEVDISEAVRVLQWEPPRSMEDELREVAQWYAAHPADH
ncbi:MAG: NAD-dependent epimerase/dehydratase family protein [Gammaproteobacteria bacterium]